MANEYTSIAAGGIATQLVQTAYDLAVRDALHTLPTCRIAATVRPERPAMRGSAVVLTKNNWYGDSTVTAQMTALNEEQDVDSTRLPASTQVTITPQEYGGATTETVKIEGRSFAPISPLSATRIAELMNRVIDRLVQAELENATNVYWGGDATQASELVNADVLTSSLLRDNVARMRAAGVPGWAGQWYLGIFHPFQVLDLREETGAAGWRTPKEYMNDGILATGEIAAWEGVRFIENSKVNKRKDGAGSGSTQTRSVNGYLLGTGGLAEAVVTEFGIRVSPQTDKLGRFHTIGWYGDAGWKIYENEAIRRIVTASSLNDSISDYIS